MARSRHIMAFLRKACVELGRCYRLYSHLGIGAKRLIGVRGAEGDEFALGGRGLTKITVSEAAPSKNDDSSRRKRGQRCARFAADASPSDRIITQPASLRRVLSEDKVLRSVLAAERKSSDPVALETHPDLPDSRDGSFGFLVKLSRDTASALPVPTGSSGQGKVYCRARVRWYLSSSGSRWLTSSSSRSMRTHWILPLNIFFSPSG